MLRCSVGRGKKTSSARPLMVYWPVPGRSVTRAIAVLRLPVARYRAPAPRSIVTAAIGSPRPGVDRDRGDRLVGDLVGVAGGRLLVVAALTARERIDALLDDVDLEV